MPLPTTASKGSDFEPSKYNEAAVDKAIRSCKTASSVERLTSIPELKHRAAATIIEMNYYPTRFDERIHIYEEVHPRRPILDLPFLDSEFNEVVFLDELKRNS